jgi:ferric-dicitrate binding protein FerR (iron transport regulator)
MADPHPNRRDPADPAPQAGRRGAARWALWAAVTLLVLVLIAWLIGWFDAGPEPVDAAAATGSPLLQALAGAAAG